MGTHVWRKGEMEEKVSHFSRFWLSEESDLSLEGTNKAAILCCYEVGQCHGDDLMDAPALAMKDLVPCHGLRKWPENSHFSSQCSARGIFSWLLKGPETKLSSPELHPTSPIQLGTSVTSFLSIACINTNRLMLREVTWHARRAYRLSGPKTQNYEGEELNFLFQIQLPWHQAVGHMRRTLYVTQSIHCLAERSTGIIWLKYLRFFWRNI